MVAHGPTILFVAVVPPPVTVMTLEALKAVAVE